MRHWLNPAPTNLEAAQIILAKAAAGDESVAPLVQWARLVVDRAGLSSPAEPGQAETFALIATKGRES